MMRYDAELHHRRSTRLRGYDYSRAGLYSVTVCTAHREPLLSAIDSNGVVLTDLGCLVERYWLELPMRFPAVILDTLLLMPDHCHAIVALADATTGTFQTRPSLSTVIRTVKSLSAVEINRSRNTPGLSFWQTRFIDRGIRDEDELERARRYIADNPGRWLERHAGR